MTAKKQDAGSAGAKGTDATKKPAPGGAEGAVGDALRSAYQEAVREEIPAEMLDLLGKLS